MQTSRNLSGNIIVGNGVSDLTLHGNTYLKGILDIVTSNPSTALTIRRTPNSTPAFTISDLGDFTINGSLTVVGNTTTIGSTSSNNPFFEINNAAVDDSVDTGTYSKYVRSATSYYTGFARKAGTGDIIFFYDATVKPINVLQTNTYQYANIYAGTVRSTSIVNAGALTTYGTADIATNLIYADSVTSRVGIKTASPLNAMDINGALAIGSYAATQTAPSNGLIVSGSVGIGTFNPTSRLHVSGSGSGVRISGQSSGEAGLSVGQTAELQVDSGTAGGRFMVRSNGNVGINNASTDRLLRITDSSSSTTTSQLYIEQSSTGDAWFNLGLTGGANYAIGIDNSDSDKLKFGYNANTASGVDTGTLLTLTSTGSLGLGTTTPSSMFDVLTTGTQLRLSNTSLIFSTLTTDASGNLNITTGGPQISYSGNIVNATWTGVTVSPVYGGTGLASYDTGDILYASGSNTLAKLTGNTTTTRKFLQQTGSGLSSAAPVWDTIIAADIPGSALTASGDTNISINIIGNGATALLRTASISIAWTGTLATTRGGTGLSTYTTGDILYASGTNTLAKLTGNISQTRRFLRQTGDGNVSGAPVWDTLVAADIPGSTLAVVNDTNVGLVLDGSPNNALLNATTISVSWSGRLSESRGGTNQSSYVLGDILFASATNTLSRLAGNTTTTRRFLRQTGTGGSSAAPVWDTITAADVASFGLTTANDTNITITAGGSPSNALLNSVSLTVGWTGTLPVSRGGTGMSTYTTGDIIYANVTNGLTVLAGNTTTSKRFLSQTGTGVSSAAPTWSAITLSDIPSAGLTVSNDSNILLSLTGTSGSALLQSVNIAAAWSGILPTNRGGTGIGSYNTGDLIVASGSNTLSVLAGNTAASRRFLRQTGTGTVSQVPAWDTILGTDIAGSAITSIDDTNITIVFSGSPNVGVLRPITIQPVWSGTLSAVRGGTGIGSYTRGDILYANATTTLAKLPGNTAPVRKYLMSIGDGTNASVPVWDVVAPTDVKGEEFSTVNDTNVTATLSGQPTTALLDPLTLTLGWTGQLSASRGGTGLGTYVIGDVLYASGTTSLTALAGNSTTTKKFFTQTGTGTVCQAPGWNTITAADVPGSALTKADDTNVTLTLGGSFSTALLNTASISAGWSGQLSILRGGTGTNVQPSNGQLLIGHNVNGYSVANLTGTSNRLAITNGAGSITLDISSSYAGQSTITTLGIISSGTWQSTAVGSTFGGTGQSTYSTGDILYSNAPDSLTKLSIAASGNALISGTTPSWGKIDLTTHVSGTLPVANGGTGATSYNAGGLVYASGATSISSLVAVVAGSVLISAGASSAPSWSTNLPVTSAAIGASYTASTPPTNGLIVQGSASIGSSSATSLFNVGSSNQFQVNSSGQVVGGTWQGSVIAPIYGGTGSNTAPINGQILIGRTATSDYIPATITGTASRLLVTNGSGSITLDIDSAYVGQTSITTLGTITTGTWSASTIAVLRGGTGTSTLPINGQILIGRTSTSDYIPATLTGTASRLLVTNGSGSITLDIDSAYVGQTSITTLGTVTTGTWSASTIAVLRGGTGTSTLPINGQILIGRTATSDYIPATITGTASRLLVTNGSGSITLNIDTAYVGQTSITTLGTVTTGVWNATAIGATYGGTGQTGYAVGDILFANTTTTLSKLAGVVTGNALISGGTNTAPSWGKIGLTTHISGTLGVGNGGTGLASTPTNGQLLIGNGTNYTLAALTGTASRLLVTNGSGSITLNIDTTYVGQTSITTLGTVTTGVWNGTVIAAANGGTGQTTYAVGDILYASAITPTLSRLSAVATGNALISGGTNTAPAWGKIGLTTHISGTLGVGNGGTGLASTPTNGQILIGNGTNYTLATLTGTASRLLVTNGSGSITLNIDTAYVGQTSITTLGTVTTGVWNGTVITPTYGGTGTGTTFTQGSVVFAGASGVYGQKNNKLFWDNTNNRLGIGTATPSVELDLWGSFKMSGDSSIISTFLSTVAYGITSASRGNSTQFNGSPGLAGFRFTVGASSIKITHMGHYTDGFIFTSGTRDVAMYDMSGTQLAIVTVTFNVGVDGGAAYTALSTPIVLSANTDYIIISTEPVSNAIPYGGTVTYNSAITFVSIVSSFGSMQFITSDVFGQTTLYAPGFKFNNIATSLTVSNNTVAVNGSVFSGSTFTSNSTGAYNTYIQGTQTTSSGGLQYGNTIASILNPAGGNTRSFAQALIPSIISPSASTIVRGGGLYINNTASSNVGTITSLYGLYVDAGTAGAGTAITNAYGGYFTVPTAGSSDVALYADNLLLGYATTVTAAGTTTLTNASMSQQFFTGSTTQTVVLPVVTTLFLGYQYFINNRSSGVVTVQSSGLNTITSLPSNTSAVFTCILTTGTGTASWDVLYDGTTTSSVSTISGTTNQITSTGTSSVTLSLPSTVVTPGSLSVLANATSVNNLSVSSVFYATGTASQSTTTVTGSGTAFTSSMLGMTLVYANGVSAGFITVVTSGTVLTVSTSQTVSSQAFTIYECSLQSVSSASSAITGNIGVGTVAPPSLFSVSPVNTSISCPGTVSQSGTTVTGSGTNFTSSMIGMILTYTTGVYGGLIIAVSSTTSLTVNVSQTVASTNYLISNPGFQVNSSGQATMYGRAFASENISSSTALSTFQDSIINSMGGALSCTLANGILDQIKTIRLLNSYCSNVTITHSAGSILLTPTFPSRTLRYSRNGGYWQIESGAGTGDISFATIQQGTKVVGTGGTSQGSSCALSADGNTLAIGGKNDNSNTGAVWVFVRVGSVWFQQGTKLVGTGGSVSQGQSCALSADGNTLAVGGSDSTWIFTRSGSVWTQQGTALVGTGATGTASQGYSCALSADGNTLATGGYQDNSFIGAVWVFTRSGSVWTQQGTKLIGTGNTSSGYQGYSCALSADGNTLATGAPFDNGTDGGAWIFTRTGGVWTQQGTKIVGTGAVSGARQANACALSADGNTLAIGGYADNTSVGATWVFTRSGSVWTQQGTKLVGTGRVGASSQGQSVGLSADGNTLAIGGNGDNTFIGAVWVFTRSGSTWTQQGAKLVGTGNVGNALQGFSLGLSADGITLASGGLQDNSSTGAIWVFI